MAAVSRTSYDPAPFVNLCDDHRTLPLKLPEVLEKLSAVGSYPIGNTPEEFAADIKRQLEVVGQVCKTEKIKRE